MLNIINPLTLAGAIIGAALPFLFSGMLIEAVAKAARKMVEEVRRQFKTIPASSRARPARITRPASPSPPRAPSAK